MAKRDPRMIPLGYGKFVRADRIGSRDELVSLALAKGRQIVDEQGEGMFSQTWPKKPN